MNPSQEDSDKLPSKTADDEHQLDLNQSMSDDEDNTSFPEDLSFRQRQLATQQQQHASAAGATLNNTRSNHSSEMKRSAVKELIERYFYQLQRGCGNTKCSNVNCASSGQVEPMTANEIAARAIQLFSQDAKLCESHTQQPPKVPRTGLQHESPTSSSRSTSNGASLYVIEDMGCSSPHDHSSTSNSTITSGSSTSTSSSSTASSSNTNISSCATEEIPLLGALNDVTNATTSNVAAAAAAAVAADISANSSKSDPPTPTLPSVEYLNEQIVDELIEECRKSKRYDRLIDAINDVCCSVKKLSISFRRPTLSTTKLTSSANASKLQEILGKSPQELKKEDLRTLEGEHDKDEDSTCMEDDDVSCGENELQLNNQLMALTDNASGEYRDLSAAVAGPSDSGVCDSIEPMDEDVANADELDDIVLWSHSCDTQVDFESLRRVKEKLHGLEKMGVREALNDNIILLAESIKYGRFYDWEKVLHCFLICFDVSMTISNRSIDYDYMELSMPKICQAAHVMPVKAQARLARIWAVHYKEYLHPFIQSLQQILTTLVMRDEDVAQVDPYVISLTKILKIFLYANILAGEIDAYNTSAAVRESEADAEAASALAAADASSLSDDEDIFLYNQILKPYHPAFAVDKLEKELNISCLDCRVPLVPFEEFYNEPLSDAIQMDRDYLSYKNLSLDPTGEENHFSFMLYSFVLTPATKVIALYYDSRIRMYSERNSSIYSLINYFGDMNDMVSQPNLKLKVRRDNLVNDALIGLELVAMSNPKDLKKQLVVEFEGEQGIDEGGVSKEFFQLIVEEIFNPDFGMFIHQEETNTMWFNSTPFENEAQFTLIGIIIGLAIYNNIILAVNFPMVVYRKLMGGRGSFYDLKDWNLTLYRSLKSMIDYDEPDMEEVFMQTFKISYKNVFDEVVEHELKTGGGEIVVNQENKQEFVDLYSDFLLNKNIEKQFKAFKKGFEMVTDESPLKLLFRPEEIELLVCGSRKFDFIELEISTEYEGGYTSETQIIKDFWSIVHNLPEESKRKLLEFTTGSDRVPVGGLSRLKLLITRHGPDSDRLPTSHTCFNVLLLPEYSSKEKLEERLLKAINYSKGFGML